MARKMKKLLLFVLLLSSCFNQYKIVAKDVYYIKGQEFYYLVLENESGVRTMCEVSQVEYQNRKFNEPYECQDE
jgi:hypothetical protein